MLIMGGIKMNKRLTALCMSAVMALAAVPALGTGVSAEWVKSSSGYSYKDDTSGKKLTGWQTIGGKKYYFDKNGIALTGWYKIGDSKYYFIGSKKGQMATGWVKVSGKQYYFGTDGKMRTGKLKINGKTYNFGTDGALKASNTSSAKGSLLGSGITWNSSRDDVVAKLPNAVDLGMMVITADNDTTGSMYLFDDNDKMLMFYNIAQDKTSYKSYMTKCKNAGYSLIAKGTEKTDEYGSVAYYMYTDKKTIAIVMYSPQEAMSMLAVLNSELSADVLDAYNGSKVDFSDYSDMFSNFSF